jgi:hypothetical protein
MVFFTIIIVSKYFIGVEDCPLFADTIANGTWDASTEVSCNLKLTRLKFYVIFFSGEFAQRRRNETWISSNLGR